MSGERSVLVPSSSASSACAPCVSGIPPPPVEDIRPTPSELKEAFSSHIAQKHGPDAPLMTKAMREREEARLGIKKKEYNEVGGEGRHGGSA